MSNDLIVDRLGEEILERVANMEISEVPVSQICIANGISLDDFHELKQTEEYENLKQRRLVKDFLFNKDLSDGWDAVETMAVRQIIDTLKYSKDPDYAMRAAMIANKAKRKGVHENVPVEAANGGVAVINLQKNFITKIQNNNINVAPRNNGKVLNGDGAEDVPKKQQDFLAVDKVENMLSPVTDKDKDGAVDVSKSLEDILIDAVG